MARRIGIMTGGGDAPGLNAVIRAAVLSARSRGWEVYGIEDATSGLIDLSYRSPHGNRWLQADDVDGILVRGGTMLGTSSSSDPFHYVVKVDGQEKEVDVSKRIVENYEKLDLSAIISIGGDGSMAIAKRLSGFGLNMVGVPKTIDNDLGMTDYTFGFQTAVQTATNAVDRLQDTARSHDRVLVAEVMGRHAGWIAVHTAIAGGAHICLIPEIPYSLDAIVEQIQTRKESGHPWSVCVVAEGSKPKGGEISYEGPKQKGKMARLGGAGNRLGEALRDRIDLGVRVNVFGHIQRGGSPIAFDRILGTRFGVKAVELVEEEAYGMMVSLRTPDIVAVPIEEATRAPARVDPDGPMVRAAKAVGVEFGG